ncbi:hypothetical protein [Paraburkholderia franconis]|uniref:hypothetical protein n=1 Tax=Paraburkholderia franconis TaxID=2654983 RepID=UPI00187B9B4F|nr:hypothetical protein [Paraburkholderia franconis]
MASRRCFARRGNLDQSRRRNRSGTPRTCCEATGTTGYHIDLPFEGDAADFTRRLDSHAADLRVEVAERREVGLIVLERVHIAFRRVLDELLVEFLPPDAIMRSPFRANLSALGQPCGKNRSQAADCGANQRG